METVDGQEIAPAGDTGFRILPSRAHGPSRTLVAPDAATCAACLAELTDPADRRHRHPFLSCTHCGPRFTIVTGVPYDRALTTMDRFPMCPRCAREYADPADRRFHAQPIACHDCGPRLRLLTADPAGRTRPPRPAPGADPVADTRRLLAEGAIVAVKGLGGYHLVCDASDDTAVALLRHRKARGDKPFALMARHIDEVAHLVRVGAEERALLTGPVRPIVLLRRTRTPPRPPAHPPCPRPSPPAAPTWASCCRTRRCTTCSSGCPATPGTPAARHDQWQYRGRTDRHRRRRGRTAPRASGGRLAQPRPADPDSVR